MKRSYLATIPEALFLLGAAPSPQSEVTLRFAPKLNTPYVLASHLVVVSTTGAGEPMSMTENSVTTFTATSRESGVTHLVVTTGKAEVTVSPGSPLEGQTEALAKAASEMKIEGDIDETGTPKKFEVKSDDPMVKSIGAGMGTMMGGMLGSQFPKDPVHEGSTWTVTIDFGPMMEAMSQGMLKVNGDSKLVIAVKVNKIGTDGGKTVVSLGASTEKDLSLEAAGHALTNHVSLKTTMDVDAADGMLLRSTIKSKSSMENPIQFEQSTTGTITRTSPA